KRRYLMRILCFDIEYVGFKGCFPLIQNNSGWKAFALKGDKISAIKEYRNVKNSRYGVDDPRRVGLREAKDKVEEFMIKNKVVYPPISQ
ncbi:MAG TPA: hypothetical protein PLR64_00460, partial [Candidatus Dojkabacteria bacterium]|nr:hypothetical protein [Candidatus Dojkabacteria bacterium]